MKITRDWMDEIGLACQGVLMLAMRGPDGSPKECPGKELTRALRAVCLNAAYFKGHDEFMGDHSGFPRDPDRQMTREFFEHHDEYPHHWLMHFIHG